ncbi:hypothetical protein K466DRAFT_109990 [Polyporus arcularius HHB13444]|uniref:Uncharacterized protein n=1 Tax=Polyporus arcularius HHB13444 TaxID=1314778 RepID=A0A5C3PZI4_9APHY|nr:hypothetical protein K466DRAFT_109990 [Polyporus arcularius HHB13444]
MDSCVLHTTRFRPIAPSCSPPPRDPREGAHVYGLPPKRTFPRTYTHPSSPHLDVVTTRIDIFSDNVSDHACFLHAVNTAVLKLHSIMYPYIRGQEYSTGVLKRSRVGP